MNDSFSPQEDLENLSRAEFLSALFANMVVQQANMALMLLGKAPHPETGQIAQDLEAAKMFIDQLEMLEIKTKGNLNKEEQRLLQQSLTGLRLSFVEAIEDEAGRSSAPGPGSSQSAPQRESAQSAPPSNPTLETSSSAGEESRKKFTKKY